MMHIIHTIALLLLATGVSSFRPSIRKKFNAAGKGYTDSAAHRKGASAFGESVSKAASRANETVGVKSLVVAGSIFGGRFHMVESLWHEELGRSMLVPLPELVTERFGETKELFAGSFGEVWKAVDSATGKTVAVKMFYTKDANDQNSHLTWYEHGDDESVKSSLEEAAKECKVALDIQAYAEENPKGASRLMQCFEDHTTLGTSITGHKVCATDPLFLVLEFAGTTTLTKWLEDREPDMAADPQKYVTRLLGIFKQLMEGIQYIMSYKDKWVHHDIKPDNVVIKETPDGMDALKMIDFGAMRKVSLQTSNETLASTIMYAPPEFCNYSDMLSGKSLSFATGFNFVAPWSFDVYSAGAILHKLTTGKDFYELLDQKKEDPSHDEVVDCMKHIMIFFVVQASDPGSRPSLFKSLENKTAAYLYSNHIANPSLRPQTEEQHHNVCVFHLGVNNIKKKGGAEYDMTKDSGHEGGSKDALDSLKAFLLDETSDRVADGFKEVAKAYRHQADKSDWLKMFSKMIAFEPTSRAKPEEVLASELLKNVETTIDPDFDAKAARKSSEDPAAGTKDERDCPAGSLKGGTTSTSVGLVAVAMLVSVLAC